MTKYHKIFPVDFKDDVLIVRPTGDVLGFRGQDVEIEMQTVNQLIDGPDIRHLVIDLGGVQYFGSTMIGMLVSFGSRVIDRGGRAAWCNGSDAMQHVLGTMQLDVLFPHMPSYRKAVKWVAGK